MTESDHPPKTSSSAALRRTLWVGSAVIAFALGTLALRRCLPPRSSTAPLPTLNVATPSAIPPDPSTAFTRQQRGFEIASHLVDDAIGALEQALKTTDTTRGWPAVLHLRAFGPKARPEVTRAVFEHWRATDASSQSFGPPPSLFAAAPQSAVTLALLEAGQELDAAALHAPNKGSAADSSPAALGLDLELATLSALRAPSVTKLRALSELASLAQTELDLQLRTGELLSARDWQLAAALLRSPPEVDPARQANLRRLWARLADTPLPSDLLTQAVRCEALSSAVKSGQIEGAGAQVVLQAELEHLRYLVNSDDSEPDLAKQQARSFALRGLRLGKSALGGSSARP